MDACTRPRPTEDPDLRLVVFHHAGGSAAGYFPLARGMPPTWDLILVDMPGRGKRRRVAPLDDMKALVAMATADVEAWAGPPIALFGHSQGALVAAETARALESRGIVPAWVGVSGRGAPGYRPHGEPGDEAIWELPDDDLLRRLAVTGGLPERISELPDFRERFLGIIRSDLRTAASYRPDPARRLLTSPVTAFSGAGDPLAPPLAMDLWALETAGKFRRLLFDGGHFYFQGDAFPDFTRAIVAEILRSAPGVMRRAGVSC
jgi:surfactin synthase thioesterase subunit